MSAYIGYAFHDRVELLTDGASTDDDGKLAATLTKVWTVPDLPFAMTGAGSQAMVERVALYLRGWANMTGVDGALDALRIMPRPDDDMSIVIAAVSEMEGPGLWVYSTRHNDYGFGKGPIPACTVTRWQGIASMGSGLEPEDIQALGLTRDDFRDGLALGGLKIMEAYRAKPCVSPTRPDLPAGHYIGGHVDHTVVSASGVETRQVRRWPDVVGERIRPNESKKYPALNMVIEKLQVK